MNKTKQICITGMGIALFVILAMVIRVPVFENYYLCLGYVAMAVYLYSVGTVSGTIVGTLGTVLYCVLTNGLRGMPGWVLGNLVIGIIVGVTFRYARKIRNNWAHLIVCIVAIVIGNILGILIVKSGVECFLYAQPFFVRVAKNIYAFVADAFVLSVSLPVCWILDGKIRKFL